MPTPTTLYLIDGYAQFFRAYHAIRTPMSSPVTKEPTNMTFGFIGMLLKLLRAESARMAEWGGKPTFIAVALDVSGDRGTFRSEIYPEYKANRSPPPDDLFPQVERCLAILREIGVPLIGAEGFEADDVIATLAHRLSQSTPVPSLRIISKDKDLKQLLTIGSRDADAPPASPAPGAVELFDIHTDLAIGVEQLKADTGLSPDQVIDMLTLMGDNVDNVPGVEGIGEKTAALLLREFSSLDHLLAKADQIKGKRGENIRAAAPRLALSKRLVTLRDDVPLEFSLETARTEGFRLERLLPILKELGFNRYQDELRALLGMSPRGHNEVSGIIPGTLPRAAHATTPSADVNAPLFAATPQNAAPTHSSEPKPPRAARTAPDPVDGGLFGSLGPTPTDPNGPESPSSPHTIVQGNYRAVTTREQLAELVKELTTAKIIAFDTETTHLSPRRAKLCGLSFTTRPGEGVYVPVRSPTSESHLDQETVLSALKPILENPGIPKVAHNLKYDLLILRTCGIRVQGFSPAAGSEATSNDATFGDTMIASYLLDSTRSSHGLESLGLALLGHTKSNIADLIGSRKDQRSFDSVPVTLATPYAAGDADLTLQLMLAMAPQLAQASLDTLYRDVEIPLVEVLAELEWNGIRVDPDELDRQRERLQSRITTALDRLDAETRARLGRTVDPDSPKQLSAALFNKPADAEPGLGIKPIKKTKTGYSTDAEVLERLAEDETLDTPIPKLILEYRQLSKLVNTYLVVLKEEIHPQTGRVHASFNQTVAATGRLASSDPNLQNIPIRTDVGRDIRRAFKADPGNVLVTADYSQIELRLLAHLSRDPALIEAFRRGDDIHTAVAAEIAAVPLDQVTKEQRSGAKMVNFGIVYGITAFGLARRLNIESSKADKIITDYKKRFSGITTFLQECVEQARANGYVETMLKRRRPIPDIESNIPNRKALAERTAINTVVQGSAADLIKLAMIDLYRLFSTTHAHLNARMLLQIHDELVFECPAASAAEVAKLVTERMEAAMQLSVPLKADAHIAENWYDGK